MIIHWTYRHAIDEILLKVALNTINQPIKTTEITTYYSLAILIDEKIEFINTGSIYEVVKPVTRNGPFIVGYSDTYSSLTVLTAK